MWCPKICPNIWTRFVSLRDTIKGHDRDTIRDTKIVSCSLLIVSLKSRDTNFLKFVSSLSLAQGHDPGTRHDRVPDKSMPVSLIPVPSLILLSIAIPSNIITLCSAVFSPMSSPLSLSFINFSILCKTTDETNLDTSRHVEWCLTYRKASN